MENNKEYELSPLARDLKAMRYINSRLFDYGLYVIWKVDREIVSVESVNLAESFFDLPAIAKVYANLPSALKEVDELIGRYLFTLCGGWLIRSRQRYLLSRVCQRAMKKYPQSMPMIIREFSKIINNIK